MKVNWRSALEYRTNFIFEILLSVLELGMYLFYWKLFFDIGGGLPGIPFEQLAALVAFNHLTYACADTLMGNQIWDAVDTIVKGRLDTFLVQPKSAIFQTFFSGAQPTRAIQVLFGIGFYFYFVPVTPQSILLLLFGLIVGTSVFCSWVVAMHAVTFRLGYATVVYKLLSVILHFAKKPVRIFSFVVRFILYTVIPAAYMGAVQSAQLVRPEPLTLLGMGVLALVAPLIAVFIFRRGLRHYESGNLIGVRL